MGIGRKEIKKQSIYICIFSYNFVKLFVTLLSVCEIFFVCFRFQSDRQPRGGSLRDEGGARFFRKLYRHLLTFCPTRNFFISTLSGPNFCGRSETFGFKVVSI